MCSSDLDGDLDDENQMKDDDQDTRPPAIRFHPKREPVVNKMIGHIHKWENRSGFTLG